jgi:hypothetical protein
VFFFGAIPWRLNFVEQPECSETWAHKIQAPGNHPKIKNTIFKTRRQFEIKKYLLLSTITIIIIMYAYGAILKGNKPTPLPAGLVFESTEIVKLCLVSTPFNAV